MERTIAAMVAGRRRWLEKMHRFKASGLITKIPTGPGRPRKSEAPKPPETRDRERVKAEAVQAIDRFVAEATAAGLMPPETWKDFPRDAATMTPPELLAEIGALALGKVRVLLLKDREIRDEDGNIVCPMDGRVERLELDLALGVAKLFARVSESAVGTQGSDKLQQILEAIGNEAAAL